MRSFRFIADIATPHQRWSLWLSLVLALFGALAPTVSHALNHARGVPVEVCTSNGPRWITPNQTDAPDADASGTPPSALVWAHCPFCLLSADHAALPPRTVLFLATAAREHLNPLAEQTTFVFVAPVPPPRGPPVSGLIS